MKVDINFIHFALTKVNEMKPGLINAQEDLFSIIDLQLL
jgi:hypothetical protein